MPGAHRNKKVNSTPCIFCFMTGRALLTNRKMSTAYGCICAGASCRRQSPAKMNRSQFYQKTKRSKRFPTVLQAAGRQGIINNYRLLTIQILNPVEKCCTWASFNISGKPHVLPCHGSLLKSGLFHAQDWSTPDWKKAVDKRGNRDFPCCL